MASCNVDMERNAELGFSSYVDGNLVESRDSSDVPIPDYKTNVYFGSFNGVGEFTNGQLDEITIWNRALILLIPSKISTVS